MPLRICPPAATAQAPTLLSRPNPFTLTAWYLGQYAAAATRAGSETPGRDVPGGRPRYPAGPQAHQLQMENQGHLLAILWKAYSKPVPEVGGASDGQAPDYVQQLVHEVQLLLGGGQALSRKHHMHSQAMHAGCPHPIPYSAVAGGKKEPGPPAPWFPPSNVLDRLRDLSLGGC